MERALEGVKETKRGYDGLTQALDAKSIQKWEKEEERATEKRGDYLKIYETKLDQGLFLCSGIYKSPVDVC
jgi:hypothetical protein